MSDTLTGTTSPCARGCTLYRRHLTDCQHAEHPDERQRCTGCLPARATHGRLCTSCHHRLARMLVDAPIAHRWLSGNLTPGTSTTRAREDHERSGGKGARGADVPAPLKLDVLDVRDLLADRLATWVDDFTQSRNIHAPRAGIDQDAALLLRWLDEVERLEWIGDWWTELAETLRDAHALAPWRPLTRRIRSVPCPGCGETNLAIYGGETDVTCMSCRIVMTEERFSLWERVLREETA